MKTTGKPLSAEETEEVCADIRDMAIAQMCSSLRGMGIAESAIDTAKAEALRTNSDKPLLALARTGLRWG